MRSRITDPFERLIISLYTYIRPRRREDYYLLYYSYKPVVKMLKADTKVIILHKIVGSYLTSIKLIQLMDNKHSNVQIKFINRL